MPTTYIHTTSEPSVPPPRSLRSLRLIALVCALAALAGQGTPAAPVAELAPGTEAPAFMLPPINPKQCGISGMVSLNQYRSREDATRPKAYLITFFASWCEPCKKELPSLQDLHVRLAPRGLVIIDVSIDTSDQVLDGLIALLTKHNITFPVLWDKYAVMGKRYKVSRLPNVILLDAEARVVRSMVGYDEPAMQKLVADIETLLGGGTVAPAPASAAPPPAATVPAAPPPPAAPAPAGGLKEWPAPVAAPAAPPPEWMKK